MIWLFIDEMCLGAGSVQLSSSQIICPKHEDNTSKKKIHIHCNASWCLLCSLGTTIFAIIPCFYVLIRIAATFV